MSSLSTLTLNTLVVFIHAATYQQTKEWSGSTFFDGWEFMTMDDPTHGFVDYQPQSSGLAYYDSATDSVIMKVDNSGSATSLVTDSVYTLNLFTH